MVKKTKQEALETRHRILDTAEMVFHQKGVSNTTLDNIAKAAGVTRGAIYWHFKNKTDVFNAMFDRVRLPLEEMAIATADEDVQDPIGELISSIAFFFNKVVTDSHYRLVFDILFNKCEFVEELGAIIVRDREVKAKFTVHLETIFTHAIQRKQLPSGLNVSLAVLTYQAMLKGILRNWLLEPDAFDLEQDGMKMMMAFFEMLACSKALRQSDVMDEKGRK